MRLSLFLLILLCGTAAHAGAWLRDQGSGFLSLSVLQKQTGQTDGALYFEYGLRPRLTLGVKVDADMTAGRVGNGTAIIFARTSVGPRDRPFKITADVGIGTTFGHAEGTLLRTGLSYGRGITFARRNGWLAIDGAAEWSLSDGHNTYKLDTTLGLTLNDKAKVMVQVFVNSTGKDNTVTLAPSVIWQPKPDRPSYQIGLEAQDDTIALRLGLWKSF